MRSRPPSVTPELQQKLIQIHDRLCQEYGCPIPYFHNLDPLSELVSALLSHRTKNADSARAFKLQGVTTSLRTRSDAGSQR